MTEEYFRELVEVMRAIAYNGSHHPLLMMRIDRLLEAMNERRTLFQVNRKYEVKADAPDQVVKIYDY